MSNLEKKKNIAKAFAKKFALNRKYQLIAEDFVSDGSYIELIFRDVYENEIVFIPIKVTRKKEFLDKTGALEYLKERDVMKTMKWFITKEGLLNETVRVDFAEVSVDGKKANMRYMMKLVY